MESNEPQPPTEETASSSERTLPLDGYISNPFTVLWRSFRQLLAVNLKTLGLLVALFVGIIVAAFAFGGVTVVLEGVVQTIFTVIMISGLIFLILGMTVAFIKYTIETARGQEASIGVCVQAGRQKVLGFALLGALMSALIMVGFVLLIIPGLVFLYWFMFAPYVYIDEDVAVIEAMKRSKHYVQGSAGEFFGLYGAVLTLSLPGAIPLFGFLYSLIINPITQVAFGYRYASFKATTKGQMDKPTTSRMNYLAILLVPIMIALFIIAGFVLAPEQPTNYPQQNDFYQSGSYR